VEGLPSGEVHGQTGHNSRPGTKLRGTETHCCSRKQTGKGAVQRIDSVTCFC
jgi:hypothetical protein